MTVEALKSSIETPGAESATPKKIPVAEKEARLKDLREIMTGVLIEGVHKPAISPFENAAPIRAQNPQLPPTRKVSVARA